MSEDTIIPKMIDTASNWLAEHRSLVRSAISAIAFATAALSGGVWYLDLNDNLFKLLLIVFAVEIGTVFLVAFLGSITGHSNEHIETVPFVTARVAVELEVPSAWKVYELIYLPGTNALQAEALKRAILAKSVFLSPEQARLVRDVLEDWMAEGDSPKDLARLHAVLVEELGPRYEPASTAAPIP